MLPAFYWIPSIIRVPLSLFSMITFYFGLLLKSRVDFIKILLLSVFIMVFNYLTYITAYVDIRNVFEHNYRMFTFWFPLLLSMYILKYPRKNLIKFMSKTLIIVLIITAITTSIGMLIYPNASRDLGDSQRVILNFTYFLMNIGDYGFIYSLVLISPILLFLWKKNKNNQILIIYFLFFITILLTQFTTALVLLIVFSYPALDKKIKFKKFIIFVFFLTLLIYLLRFQLANILFDLSIYFEKNQMLSISERFSQLHSFLNGDIKLINLSYRVGFNELSINSFQKNPIFGNLFLKINNPIGYHSEIFDLLGSLGLFGLIYLILIISTFIRYVNQSILPKISKNAIYFILVSTLILGILNTLFSSQQIGLIIFIGSILLVFEEEL